MRREYTLSATQPYFSAELTFTPSTVIILNNTDQPVYLAVGSLLPPSAMFYDKKILPTAAGIPSNVALPNNSYQFAGYLPTPTDTSNNVKVIFQGTADPFSNKVAYPQRGGGVGGNPLTGGGRMRNYKEFRMNASNQRQVIELPFWADMMFVLNNTDKEIVFQQGGTLTPNGTYNDLTLPAVSYTILQPHGGFQYAAFLDNPTSDDCWIIFTYGYADEYMALKQMGFDWDWYLPPLIIPGIIIPQQIDLSPYDWCFDFDFTLGQLGWSQTGGSYIAGLGFRSGGAAPTITINASLGACLEAAYLYFEYISTFPNIHSRSARANPLACGGVSIDNVIGGSAGTGTGFWWEGVFTNNPTYSIVTASVSGNGITAGGQFFEIKRAIVAGFGVAPTSTPFLPGNGVPCF